MIKFLIKECNASVNGESSVVFDFAVATKTLIYSIDNHNRNGRPTLCTTVNAT